MLVSDLSLKQKYECEVWHGHQYFVFKEVKGITFKQEHDCDLWKIVTGSDLTGKELGVLLY